MNSELIILIISFGFLVVGIVLLQKGNDLLRNGKKADAIIFDNNFHTNTSTGGKYFPVVRFLNDKQEWIIQELSTGYSPAKPVGKQIQVLYDPGNPARVEIKSKLQLQIIPITFIILGIGGLIFGLLEYFAIIDLIKVN